MNRWRCGGCKGWFDYPIPGTSKEPWLCENCKILGRTDKRYEPVIRDTVAKNILKQVWPE